MNRVVEGKSRTQPITCQAKSAAIRPLTVKRVGRVGAACALVRQTHDRRAIGYRAIRQRVRKAGIAGAVAQTSGLHHRRASLAGVRQRGQAFGTLENDGDVAGKVLPKRILYLLFKRPDIISSTTVGVLSLIDDAACDEPVDETVKQRQLPQGLSTVRAGDNSVSDRDHACLVHDVVGCDIVASVALAS